MAGVDPIKNINFFETPRVQPKALAEVSAGGGQAVGGGSVAQKEIGEVSKIGESKRATFENGLGGTNNPDDHRVFYHA